MKKNVGLHYSPYDVECDGAEPQTGKRNKEIEKVKSVKAFRFNLWFNLCLMNAWAKHIHRSKIESIRKVVNINGKREVWETGAKRILLTGCAFRSDSAHSDHLVLHPQRKQELLKQVVVAKELVFNWRCTQLIEGALAHAKDDKNKAIQNQTNHYLAAEHRTGARDFIIRLYLLRWHCPASLPSAANYEFGWKGMPTLYCDSQDAL